MSAARLHELAGQFVDRLDQAPNRRVRVRLVRIQLEEIAALERDAILATLRGLHSDDPRDSDYNALLESVEKAILAGHPPQAGVLDG